MARPPKKQDRSGTTWKDEPSEQDLLWVAKFKAEEKLPYRQRNWPQSRRDSLARALRTLRRERSAKTPDGS